ncbi:hypothetical protein BDW42DRAFT_9464 [Aspergillus taichungensis]|uniref:Uncharacterized protein n=1 Tax=Aspergillus taichungensis TaxID=482145 RepID=A0A2J5HJ61_9EURO|nr:hypothetical protein BDW42DRAFT_9464 [Aspergillus taichungensis]
MPSGPRPIRLPHLVSLRLASLSLDRSGASGYRSPRTPAAYDASRLIVRLFFFSLSPFLILRVSLFSSFHRLVLDLCSVLRLSRLSPERQS